MADREKLPLSMSFYDLLGYLAPGGLLVLCIYVFEQWALRLTLPGAALSGQALHTPIHTLAGLLLSQKEDPGWLAGGITALSMGLTAYVAGHVIASISSALIERTLVFKGYGYPYETQLDIKRVSDEESARWAPVSRAFYTGLFFWFNIYALLRYLSLTSPTEPTLSVREISLWSARGVGAGLAILVVAKLYLGYVHSAARRGGSPRPDPRSTGLGKVTVGFIVGTSRPYDAIGRLIAGVMGTRRVFDQEFRERYIGLFKDTFGLDPEKAGTNNFWLSYAHVLESSRSLRGRIANWQTLYGFARNLATAFFTAFLYCWFWYRLHRETFATARGFDVTALAVIGYGCYGLSLILLLRYYYLYRGYFTKFVFRAFVYTAGREKAKGPDQVEDGEGLGF